MNLKIDKDKLNNLSEQEKKIALQILSQYSQKGTSSIYKDLLYEDYEEIPVDIETFLDDPNYLGRGTISDGKSTVFPYWRETLKKIFPNNTDTAYNTLVLTGAIGLGKAQPLSTPVLTTRGYVPMRELSLNDLVYGPDGLPHSILGIFPQGKKDIYKVSFTDGSSTFCCKEHLWQVYHKSDSYRSKKYNVAPHILTVEQLLSKTLVHQTKEKGREHYWYIPMTSPVRFPHKDVTIHPYVLGCLLGDGHLGNTIHLTTADSEIIERVSQVLDPSCTIRTIPSSKYEYSIVSKDHSSNLYKKELERLNLLVLSPQKHIPSDYLYNDIQTRIDLLQGLMDTDGTINKNGSTITFDTTSAQLRDDMIWLVQSLGGVATYKTRHPYYKNKVKEQVRGLDSYCIRIKLSKDICPFSLSRKKNRLRQNRKNPSRYIDKIEKLDYQEDCQCIYLNSADHLYLTNDFIVTHNTFIAVICILYMLYRTLCLKDPYKHYGLQQIDVITFAFMNITLDAAEGVAWSKCQELLKSSPWFMSKGHMSRSKDDPIWVAPKGIELIFGSTPDHVIGRCLFAAFEDEISFQRNKDVNAQKAKARALISSIDARMKSRFMKGEKLPTLNILASSKRTEQSYLESFIEQKRKNESKTTLIVDEPQWVIRTDKDTPNKFLVAVGNKFLASEVLPLDVSQSAVDEYKVKGYTIIKVPMGYYENFIDDIDIALTDIAGISTTNTTKYISGVRWNECVTNKIENPMSQEVIEVGNSKNDTAQYYDYFDLTKIPQEMKMKPLFIHLDMSISGDKTGIAGVWIKGKRPSGPNEPQSKTLYYELAFSFAVKAPKGYQISFEKNKQFIYWLRDQGFSIKHITADTFQSTAVLQDLSAHDFQCDILSVDRVDSGSKICLPYQYLKTTVYEKNIEVYKTALLTEEVINLERDGNGRIDHPMGGTVGSKDIADALCGATYTASKYAEEYAYDYGEDYDAFIESNRDPLVETQQNKKQMVVDFEEELKNMDPMGRSFNKNKEQQDDNSVYIFNDTLIW